MLQAAAMSHFRRGANALRSSSQRISKLPLHFSRSAQSQQQMSSQIRALDYYKRIHEQLQSVIFYTEISFVFPYIEETVACPCAFCLPRGRWRCTLLVFPSLYNPPRSFLNARLSSSRQISFVAPRPHSAPTLLGCHRRLDSPPLA